MIKYYSKGSSAQPSSSAEDQAASTGSRKSLKERLTEGELAVFLRERRAVSESRLWFLGAVVCLFVY